MHSNGYLCRNPGYGISAGLGRKSRRTGHPGIYLDKVVSERLGVKGKLYVASAFDLKFPYYSEGTVPEKVVFLICKRLAWSDNYGVSRMYSDGIHVFHITYSNGRVICVTHYFVLYFLISFYALFNEYLMNGRKLKSVFHYFPEFFLIVGESAACSSEGKGGTENDGISDLFGNLKTMLYGCGYFRLKNGLSERYAKLLEKLPILGSLYTFPARSEHLNAAFVKHAVF